MSDRFDLETGELQPSNGAAATAIAAQARLVMQQQKLGIGNRSLNDAVEHALNAIPVWIKATASSGRGNAKYATLKEILEVVRPALLECRVRIRQGAERSLPCDEGGGTKGRLVPVYTDLIHTVTGEVERTIIEMPIIRLDPQAMGSAITYGKRYSLLAALGLATDEADDDGERAKPRDLAAAVSQSHEFMAMLSEIDRCKDTDALVKWGNDAKTKRRINDLSDDEATLVRKHYQDAGRKLLGGDE